MKHRLLHSAHALTPTIHVSSKLPKGWRVWIHRGVIVQICIGDRQIFESAGWHTPGTRAMVVLGPNYPGAGVLMGDMDTVGTA